MAELTMGVGEDIYELVKRLFPIHRSITGKGFRESLRIIKEYLPEIEIGSIRSGERCFDWTVPEEWDIEEAYIEELPSGKRVVDIRDNNLHIVSYSEPFEGILTFEELEKHLHYREDLPDAIPYVTSYYHRTWGFCLSYNQFKSLDRSKKYRVVIRSSLFKGELNWGEVYIPGNTDKEVVFSTYLCHPSMANNELSGPALCTFLGRYIKSKERRKLSYRILFLPETIGSICYISRNLKRLKEKVIAGFVVTCVGDDREFSYLPSRYGNTLADKLALNILEHHTSGFKRYSFLDRGSDERQYCSPGVDLPFCSVMRSKYGEYLEYHTSLDNLELVSPSGLEGSYDIYTKMIDVLENNSVYVTTTLCEPQMSRRNLYHKISHLGWSGFTKLMMDFLAYADGLNDLIDIANIIGKSAYELIEVKDILLKHGLLREL